MKTKEIAKEKSVAKKKYRKLGWSFWLTIAGGVILFGAWVAQNHYKAKWDTEIQMLQRSQLVVDIEEVKKKHEGSDLQISIRG